MIFYAEWGCPKPIKFKYQSSHNHANAQSVRVENAHGMEREQRLSIDANRFPESNQKEAGTPLLILRRDLYKKEEK